MKFPFFPFFAIYYLGCRTHLFVQFSFFLSCRAGGGACPDRLCFSESGERRSVSYNVCRARRYRRGALFLSKNNNSSVPITVHTHRGCEGGVMRKEERVFCGQVSDAAAMPSKEARLTEGGATTAKYIDKVSTVCTEVVALRRCLCWRCLLGFNALLSLSFVSTTESGVVELTTQVEGGVFESHFTLSTRPFLFLLLFCRLFHPSAPLFNAVKPFLFSLEFSSLLYHLHHETSARKHQNKTKTK